MIYVNNAQFNISELEKDLSEGSVERIVLTTMNESEANYRFKSENELAFELTLRNAIVDAARELDKSGFGFSVFSKSECNEKYWQRENNGGFSLRQNAKPSDAIKDIFTNGRLYRNECATAMVIVYYGALLSVFEDRFDTVFPFIYLMNWQIIDPLLEGIGYPEKVSDTLLGDRAYVKNPDVNPEIMWLQGENVIVLPNDLYYGHGVGIHDLDYFVSFLNRNRKRGATQSAYLMEEMARPDFKLLSDVFHEERVIPRTIRWRPF